MKKNRRFWNALYLSRDVLAWFIRAMEDCASTRNNRATVQTKRDGNRVFLMQRYQNHFERFIKLLELGTGKGKGIIAIPKESNGNGKSSCKGLKLFLIYPPLFPPLKTESLPTRR